MNEMKSVLVSLAAVMFASGALAQESLVEHTYNACKSDIDQYCSQVTPGEGRLLHCLAAHEDKIGTGCELALYSSAMIISEMAMELAREVLYAVEYLAMECEVDIDEHCGKVMPGEGRILMCLSEHEAELSESCTAAANEVFGE